MKTASTWVSILISVGYFVFKIVLPILRGVTEREEEESGYVVAGEAPILPEISSTAAFEKHVAATYHAITPAPVAVSAAHYALATQSQVSSYGYPGVTKLLMPTEAKDPSHYYPGVAKLLMPTEAKDPFHAYPRLEKLLLTHKERELQKLYHQSHTAGLQGIIPCIELLLQAAISNFIIFDRQALVPLEGQVMAMIATAIAICELVLMMAIILRFYQYVKHMVLSKVRRFLPANLQVTDWDSIKGFYELLLKQEIHSLEDLRAWLACRSELDGAVSEEAGWRYIHMTCDTGNEQHRKNYASYITNLLPHIMSLSHQLDEKVVQSPHSQVLAKEKGYDLLLQGLKTNIQLYREENTPLLTQTELRAQEYGKIVGEMSVVVAGQELTLPQAATYLESTDRKVREDVFRQMTARRLQDKTKINEIYSDLIKDRHAISCNAGFADFASYSFKSLRRFDYDLADCYQFHDSIQQIVVPFVNEIAAKQKESLQVEKLRPWDHDVDPQGRPPLRAFQTTDELLQKTIKVLDRVDIFLGDCLRTMQHMGQFDLDSRKGKAPGGYNYPLLESGIPFIFMNAAEDFQQVITLLHESGHAVHSFLMHDLPLNDFKQTTSEMAELASMSMELITMDHWDVFLKDPMDLKRAKRNHLEGIMKRLVWIACIDKFQHWVYHHPGHTVEARQAAWCIIFDLFMGGMTDWKGFEEAKFCLWQKQLHLFEVPFYYIEYGIAQLGAIGIWKNYEENPIVALQNYLKALQLGYTCSLPKMYETAGTRFDLSSAHIKSLVDFVREEWKKLV
eukprot:gene2986-3729_t